MRSQAYALLLTPLLIVAATARANDGYYGGEGRTPVLQNNADVRLESEVLTLEVNEAKPSLFPSMSVQATFRFRNLTTKPLEVRLGFPDERCPQFVGTKVNWQEQMLRNLVITVRGKAVTTRRQNTEGAPNADTRCEPIVHLFTMKLGPSEVAETITRYQVAGSFGVGLGGWFRYVLRTGASWAGPIGSFAASLRVHRSFLPMRLVAAPPGVQIWENTDGTSLRWWSKDFEPSNDLEFELNARDLPTPWLMEMADTGDESARRVMESKQATP